MTDPANVAAFVNDEAVQRAAAHVAKVTPMLPSVLLAQWGNETAWGTSSAFVNGHNLAGISSGGEIINYATLGACVVAYVETIDLGSYDAVRAAKDAGPVAQAKALGESPWAGGHYTGTAPFDYPGGALVAELEAFDLVRFDTLLGAGPGTTPPPPQAFSHLAPAVAARIVVAAYVLVLDRTPTEAEWAAWIDGLTQGTHEPAQLVAELSHEPQSFVSPLVVRDAAK